MTHYILNMYIIHKIISFNQQLFSIRAVIIYVYLMDSIKHVFVHLKFVFYTIHYVSNMKCIIDTLYVYVYIINQIVICNQQLYSIEKGGKEAYIFVEIYI